MAVSSHNDSTDGTEDRYTIAAIILLENVTQRLLRIELRGWEEARTVRPLRVSHRLTDSRVHRSGDLLRQKTGPNTMLAADSGDTVETASAPASG
jgi:hypothetical protein